MLLHGRCLPQGGILKTTMKQSPRVFYRHVLTISVLLLSQLMQAQVIVPDIEVAAARVASTETVQPHTETLAADAQMLAAEASAVLRQLLEHTTGMSVHVGSLATLGMQSSLEPDTTALVAEMSGGQYGVTAVLEPLESARARLALRVQVASSDGALTASFRETFPLGAADGRQVYAEAVQVVASDIGRLIREHNGIQAALTLVRSEPAASFYLDGVWVGQGRTIELELAPGDVAIEARAEGFLSGRRELTLEAAQTKVVQFALIPAASGSVQVRSVPEADIYVSGFAHGSSPATIPTAEGEHEVFVFRPGFRPETFAVEVKKFRVSRLDVALTPITDNLLFWDAPAGFDVYINGDLRQGYVPNPLPGVVEVEMRRVGQAGQGRSIRFEVVLEREGIFELDFFTRSLEPLDTSAL